MLTIDKKFVNYIHITIHCVCSVNIKAVLHGSCCEEK